MNRKRHKIRRALTSALSIILMIAIIAVLCWLGFSAWKCIYYSDLPDWLKFFLLRS